MNLNNDWAVNTYQSANSTKQLPATVQAEKDRLLNDPKGGYFANLKKLFS